MQQDTITVVGFVGTPPKHVVTSTGLQITNFRLASTPRKWDRNTGKFVDGETNWYSVSAWRQLAVNAIASLEKGDRVIVTGRLKVQNWENGAKSGINVEIEADAIGQDLTWGTTRLTKTGGARTSGREEEVPQAEEPIDPDSMFADVAEPAPEKQFLPDAADAATPF